MNNSVLINSVWPHDKNDVGPSLARNTLLAIAGSLLIWLSAKVQIPFYPVPMTMQTLVVLVIGATLGSRLGVATVLLYLAQGAIGLPVFAGSPEKGIGLAYMMGPTGGFLLGFVFAAGIVGRLAERGWDRSILSMGLAMLLGNIVMYVPGLLWLGSFTGWEINVFAIGLTPFVYGDMLKLVFGAALLPYIWSLIDTSK